MIQKLSSSKSMAHLTLGPNFSHCPQTRRNAKPIQRIVRDEPVSEGELSDWNHRERRSCRKLAQRARRKGKTAKASSGHNAILN